MTNFWILGSIIAIAICTNVITDASATMALYVATNGNDAWSGMLPDPNSSDTDGPFLTLQRARDEIRKIKQTNDLPQGGIVVEVGEGTYELTNTLTLDATDSGTPDSPITYRSQSGKQVRLVGGRMVSGWKPVSDPEILKRMDSAAHGKVYQADLLAQGITDLGKMKAGTSWGASSPGLEVFYKNAPMTLSRWPNKGFVTIPKVLGETRQDIRGTIGCMEGIFTYEGDRPSRWVGEKDIMLEGYWFWDWADQRLKVESIDTENHVITLEKEPQHGYGFRNGMYYYAYNLLPELDQPGEWYLDRETGILYLWPPSELDDDDVMISMLPNLLLMQNVSNVTFRGFTFEGTRATALELHNVKNVEIQESIIRNTGDWGAVITGYESGIVGCDLYNLASGGIMLSGGDRPSLTAAGLYVDNCHMYRFGRWNPICKPGVTVDGVGNRVTHCLFNDAPHMAVIWGGNDHLFEYNEFHSVVQGANDAGIMYAGYNPTMRGHVIRYNYFHHVYGFEGKGCNGVYLDDMFCSATIYGNVFQEVPRAAFIGGGHDNIVENNIFIDCRPALHVDARMTNWAAPSVPIMKQRLEEMPYREEPWRTRFPQMLTYLEGDYAVPRGNLVSRNICWGGTWDEIEGTAVPGVLLKDNLVNEDPLFVDAANGDFSLKPESPAFKLGFEPIPLEKIGLYEDALRVTWPVKTKVTLPDMPKSPEPVVLEPGPTFNVHRKTAEVVIDGQLMPEEWNGLSAEQAMTIAQGLERQSVSPGSRAWLYHDGTHLLVAVENEVNPTPALKTGNQWGRDDAIELAFRSPAPEGNAPILILRGYPSGYFMSSGEAGAPVAVVQQAAQGVEYAAKITDDTHWTAEWRIPLASLELDMATTPVFPFNLAIRKTAGPEWVLWVGTNHATWNVANAGFLALIP